MLVDQFKLNQDKQDKLNEHIRSQELPARSYKMHSESLVERAYGFKKSYESMMSVDKHGEPIPWMTYPAVFYIERLDLLQRDVFEWGSGNSTIFFSKRAQSLTSVESNPEWFEYVQSQKLVNAELSLENSDNYALAIKQKNKLYDVISIDGDIYRRFECAHYAVDALKEGGMIILDNSDWLPNTTAFLRDKGLIQIDFAGLGPINDYAWCTSIFLTKDFSIPNNGRVQPGYVAGGLDNERD